MEGHPERHIVPSSTSSGGLVARVCTSQQRQWSTAGKAADDCTTALQILCQCLRHREYFFLVMLSTVYQGRANFDDISWVVVPFSFAWIDWYHGYQRARGLE